jgi:hypothetical protein
MEVLCEKSCLTDGAQLNTLQSASVTGLCHDGESCLKGHRQTTMDTNTKNPVVKVSRKDALVAVMSAMDTLTETFGGNRADALHAIVQGHDVSTRMQALYRYIPSGPDELGKALTVDMRYGGYDVKIVREDGRPDVTISCPDVNLVDRKGTQFATDKYGATGADNLTQAINKICPAIGRLGHQVAQAALTVHVPKSDTDTSSSRPRKSSASDEKLSALEKQIAEQNAVMQAILAKLSGN